MATSTEGLIAVSRDRILLGPRPDGASVAQGGASDLSLLAAPPIAFAGLTDQASAVGLSFSPSPRHSDVPVFRSEESTTEILPLVNAFAPVSLDATDTGGASAFAAHQSGIQTSAPPSPQHSTGEDGVLTTTAVGSGGGAYIHPGLHDSASDPPIPVPSSGSPAEVAAPAALPPILSAVQDSAVSLQAALQALTAQLAHAASPGTEALPDAIGEQFGTTTQEVEGLAQALTPITEATSTLTDALISPVGGLIDGLETPVGAIVGGITDPVVALVPPVASPIETIITPVAATVPPLVTDTVEQLAEILQPATAVVGPAADMATDAAVGIVAPIGSIVADAAEVAAPVIDAVQDATAPVADSVTDMLAPVTNGLAGMLGASTAQESVADMSGTDPVGGVATLTSLVSAADIFETHDEAPAMLDIPVMQDVFGSLDTLIAGDSGDAAPGLIGKDDPDGSGLLSSILHHDSDDGTGLGLGL